MRIKIMDVKTAPKHIQKLAPTTARYCRQEKINQDYRISFYRSPYNARMAFKDHFSGDGVVLSNYDLYWLRKGK